MSAQRVIIVHGMRRSGNHGIINWLRGQGRFLFLNDVSPPSHLRGKLGLPPPDFDPWLLEQLRMKIRRVSQDST